ncbi:MAG: hypothetical protein HC886_03835 [Leptolyngbyaceae cyanobacterium SM1_1_3]|nr:hypothetical protein [Leptolyngbyaceae cyanobacterium SM1_1_3]NJN01544.1 hypothetical protein [Leptolyngbyaceae cyanobacterium RM1_1_2]NJO09847.1 hypothetical protein [Leptolyngbyaceae cyanobacterium SL_1_1]
MSDLPEPGYDSAIAGPPPRIHSSKSGFKETLAQGWEFVRFVWKMSSRIRSPKNRLRFVIGLILWKPILPKE